MKIMFDPEIPVTPGDFGDVVGETFHAPAEFRNVFKSLGIRNAETLLDFAVSSPEDIADLTNWSVQDVSKAADLLITELKQYMPQYFEVRILSTDKFGFGAAPPISRKPG